METTKSVHTCSQAARHPRHLGQWTLSPFLRTLGRETLRSVQVNVFEGKIPQGLYNFWSHRRPRGWGCVLSLSCRAPELGLRGLGLLQLMEPLGLWRQLRPESLVDSGGLCHRWVRLGSLLGFTLPSFPLEGQGAIWASLLRTSLRPSH